MTTNWSGGAIHGVCIASSSLALVSAALEVELYPDVVGAELAQLIGGLSDECPVLIEPFVQRREHLLLALAQLAYRTAAGTAAGHQDEDRNRGRPDPDPRTEGHSKADHGVTPGSDSSPSVAACSSMSAATWSPLTVTSVAIHSFTCA